MTDIDLFNEKNYFSLRTPLNGASLDVLPFVNLSVPVSLSIQVSVLGS